MDETNHEDDGIIVRNTQPADIDAIIELSRIVYTRRTGWTRRELESHLCVFPEGQFVAEEQATGRIVGMAASLIVVWDDYELSDDWQDFTDNGLFTNHDPQHGRTLYGAEVMVHPDMQGRGVGKKIYAARRDLCRRLNLLRIRAGALLPGYHRYADRMTAREYVDRVVAGEIGDPTLSFQLSQGFKVIGMVSSYIEDRESLGNAAIIEWLNPAATTV